MLIHPLTLALAACDLAAAALLAAAAWHAAAVAAGWNAGAADAAQLALERRAEAASVLGRWGAALFLLAGLILVVAVSGALPPVVPGAMCGTGVVQATGGAAGRALGLRLAALVLLALWRGADQLDRAAPLAPLAPTAARLLLLAVPVAVVAALGTARALAALDVHTPVDCCAAVFDRATSLRQATVVAGLSDRALIAWTGAGWLALLLLGAGTLRARRRLGFAATALAALWVPLAALAVVRVFSAYHYGVLHHHCPWCLFLVPHRLVGYPLLGSLLVVLLQAPVADLVRHWGRAPGVPAAAAASQARQAALAVVAALILFGLLAGGPALLWRWTHGVWLTG